MFGHSETLGLTDKIGGIKTAYSKELVILLVSATATKLFKNLVETLAGTYTTSQNSATLL